MADALSVAWLRRDLRVHDHAVLFHALEQTGSVQPVFVFDTDILTRFPDSDDRRLSFIADALRAVDAYVSVRGGRLLIIHGSARELMPKLASALGAARLFAAEDYEPAAIVRDTHVRTALDGRCHVRFIKDQLVFSPWEAVRGKDNPYKIFTPYSRCWRNLLTPVSSAPFILNDNGRYADRCAQARAAGFLVLDASSPEAMLSAVGYRYRPDPLWAVDDAPARLSRFVDHHVSAYPAQRDMVAQEGTSRLSPYLRFGLISVRQCVQAALDARAEAWLSELIWREFYAMILYYFPESATQEWNPKYRGTLDWSSDATLLEAWKDGLTGYPLVDAAMRQLKAEGWMHNRARMVVASFLTKHLRIDWRLGEAHFARWLMDYDMASNVGGWQWAASTGTDAQPYFRVFNPVLQSAKCDPEGAYIRKYVPELRAIEGDAIHAPWRHEFRLDYPRPVVEHTQARDSALAMFKAVS